MIDSVLEPLIPISLRQSEFFVNLDAEKLLSKSSLYDLDGHRTRVFHGAADLNRRTQMFSVEGKCFKAAGFFVSTLNPQLTCANEVLFQFRGNFFLSHAEIHKYSNTLKNY